MVDARDNFAADLLASQEQEQEARTDVEEVGFDFGAVGDQVEAEAQQRRDEEAGRGPSALDITAAALRSENVVGSIFHGPDGVFDVFGPNLPRQMGYDPLDDIEGVYLDYASSFVYADNPEEVEWIKRKIDMELRDRQTLAEAGGWGIVASVGAGVVDPINLVPVAGTAGKAFQAGRIGAGLGRGARAGFAAGVITEVPLQMTQETRTVEESLTAIGATTMLSGTLGGLAAGVNKVKFNRMSKELQDYVNDDTDLTDLIRNDRMDDSVGAARTDQDDLTLGGTDLGNWVAKRTPKMISPAIRAITSASNQARSVMERLAEDPFLRKSHSQGKARTASVELRAKRIEDGTVVQSLDVLTAGWQSARKALKAAGTRVTRANREEFFSDVTRTMRRLDGFEPDGAYEQAVFRTAQQIKSTVFDPIYRRGVEAGRFDSDDYIGNYVTQRWMPDVINSDLENFNALVSEVLQRGGMDAGEASVYADNVIERMLGDADRGVMTFDLPAAPEGSVFKARTFNIPSDMLPQFEQYLDNNIDNIVRNYARTAVGEIELYAQFGSRDLRDEISEINTEYLALKKDNPDVADALERERKAIIKDLDYVVNGILGTGNRPSQVTNWFLKFNALRQLGGMTISALSDPGRLIMTHGTRRTAGTLANMVTDLKGVKLAKDELRAFGVGVEMELNTRFQEMLDLGRPAAYATKKNPYTKSMDWFMSRLPDGARLPSFGQLTLMDQWNTSWKRLAGVISQQRNIDQIDKLLKGTIDEGELARLARLGIDEDMAEKIAAQLRKKGIKGRQGNLTIVDYIMFDDAVAREAMQDAIFRESLEIINTPTIATMPEWARTNDIWRLFFQYKSFMVASHQQTLIAGLQRGDRAFVEGAISMVLLGGFSSMIKRGLRYSAPGELYNFDAATQQWEEEKGALLVEAVDQSGVLALPMEINNMADKIFGVSLQRFSGGNEAERYVSRNKTQAVLGPTIGTVEDLLQLAGSITDEGSWSAADTRRVRKLTPLQNLFYVRWAFDEMEEGLNDALGVKEK